jgi:hypothetical protein
MELAVGTGVCLVARPLYGPQLWCKPLAGDRYAVLILNIAEEAQDFALPLIDVPGARCSAARPCAVRDVWARTDLPAAATHIQLQLRQHQSAFLIVSSAV